MNDQIEKMFHEHKYKEVIDQLEDYAENHKLSLDDINFKYHIYSKFLHSCLNLNQVEKCGYFCRKFLRQIISYLNEQTNPVQNANNTIEIVDVEESCLKSKKLAELFDFISDLLDIFQKYSILYIKTRALT